MTVLEAVTAFHAICQLIDNSASTGVMFNYALARNKRMLQPIVEAHTRALLTCDDASELGEREVMVAVFPISVSWIPNGVGFWVIDALYPLLAGPPAP